MENIKYYKSKKDYIRLVDEMVGDIKQIDINNENFDVSKFLLYLKKNLLTWVRLPWCVLETLKKFHQNKRGEYYRQ